MGVRARVALITRVTRVTRVVAAAFAVAVLGVACTNDDPEQPLPCEFYEGQVETGAIELDEVPDERCRERIESGRSSG